MGCEYLGFSTFDNHSIYVITSTPDTPIFEQVCLKFPQVFGTDIKEYITEREGVFS